MQSPPRLVAGGWHSFAWAQFSRKACLVRRVSGIATSTSRRAGSGGQALLALTLLLLLLALHHALPCCLLSPHLTHCLTTPHRRRVHHPFRRRRQPQPCSPPTMSARGVGAGLRPVQSGPLTAPCLC